MANLRLRYYNRIDGATIYGYTSALATMPASNLQNQLLCKKWKASNYFTVYSGNLKFPFTDVATATVYCYSIPSGTYTGSGLATVLQSGINSVGPGAGTVVTYNSTTKKFAFTKPSGVLRLMFKNATYSSTNPALILGFQRATNYTGSLAYSGTATVGNEQDIIFDFSASASVNSVVIANHNLTSGSVIRIRCATRPDAFKGGWGPAQTGTITGTHTATWSSGTIIENFTGSAPRSIQLYTLDICRTATYMGRVFAGTYKQFAYHASGSRDLTYKQKARQFRSGQFVTQGGATLFDRNEPLTEYIWDIDPLDPYYNSATRTVFSGLIEHCQDNKAFFLTWDAVSESGSTVYVFMVDPVKYTRMSKTPVFDAGTITLREQK